MNALARPEHATGRRRGTLRSRIVFATALITTIGMGALVALVVLLIDRSTDREVAADLDTRVAAVQATASDSDVDPASADDALYDTLSWVYDGAGRLTAGPKVPPVLRSTLAHLSSASRPTEARHAQYQLKSAPITAHHERLGTAVVALNLTPYQGVLRRAAAASAGLGAAVIVGMTVLSAVIVRRSLGPVAAMAATADGWSQDRLDQRFDLGAPHDEITELGAVLDRLLERVGRSIRAEQRLTGELAHELRTPLTVVHGEAELGAAAHPGDAHDRFVRIAAAADEMGAAMTVLLDLARGRIGADARADVTEAVTTVAERYHDSRVRIARGARRPSAAVPLELIERIVAPVLENASRYADRSIEIAVTQSADAVRVSVANDGPGVDADGGDIFDPGVHAVDSPGSGLGLSLARRLARTAGGDVRLSSRSPVMFEIVLPVMAGALPVAALSSAT